jgi:hypothetical protein
MPQIAGGNAAARKSAGWCQTRKSSSSVYPIRMNKNDQSLPAVHSVTSTVPSKSSWPTLAAAVDADYLPGHEGPMRARKELDDARDLVHCRDTIKGSRRD